MDHLSQIQSYILAITKLMTKTVEKLQGAPLSPIQAQALSEVYSDTFAAATNLAVGEDGKSVPQTVDTKKLSKLVLLGLQKWKDSADEVLLAVSEIFARIAEADLLIAALPLEFASEEDQLRELATLKIVHEEEEKRLRLAEADALYCKSLLKGILEENALHGSMTVDFPREFPNESRDTQPVDTTTDR